MKRIFTSIIILFFCFNLAFSANKKARVETDTAKIQLALLLDVSGSMNGLINQAQGQLWNLVNVLSTYQKKDIRPTIELALITYGNGIKVPHILIYEVLLYISHQSQGEFR